MVNIVKNFNATSPLQYLRQLSGLDFSAWAMNTTHWHQMFSDIRNKNQIRCLRMYFLISRVNILHPDSVSWGKTLNKEYSSLYPLSRRTRSVYPLRCDRDASVFFTEIELTLIKLAIFLAKVLPLINVLNNPPIRMKFHQTFHQTLYFLLDTLHKMLKQFLMYEIYMQLVLSEKNHSIDHVRLNCIPQHQR